MYESVQGFSEFLVVTFLGGKERPPFIFAEEETYWCWLYIGELLYVIL
jgi:hypothetical protein